MAYQRNTFTPTRHRVKTPPNNEDLIQRGNTIHAFLAKVQIDPTKQFDETGSPFSIKEQVRKNVSSQQQASVGFFNQEGLNSRRNNATNSRFDLWITEAKYGYSAIGPSAVSKYYSRTYTHSFKLTPASIQGVCRDENEYDDLGDFIREGQIAASQNHENVFRLYIPGAKIDYIGMIEDFQGGFNANNRGIPLAPKFNFDFTIFKDLNDNVQKFGTTARTIIYNFDTDAYWVQKFNDYKRDYIVGQLIDNGLTDDTKPVVTGFNNTVQSIGSAAIDAAGVAAAVVGSAVYEGVTTSLEAFSNNIQNSIGRL
jgi:hypothetical protein